MKTTYQLLRNIYDSSCNNCHICISQWLRKFEFWGGLWIRVNLNPDPDLDPAFFSTRIQFGSCFGFGLWLEFDFDPDLFFSGSGLTKKAVSVSLNRCWECLKAFSGKAGLKYHMTILVKLLNCYYVLGVFENICMTGKTETSYDDFR
jgi:hypothetical protein